MPAAIERQDTGNSDSEKNDEDEEEDTRHIEKRLEDQEKKMFNPSLDPYDVPLNWWESEHVKFAISYKQVRSRLLSLMRSDIIRLTDRKYILRLGAMIQQDREEKQKARIESRKLPQPSMITKLLEMSRKEFENRMQCKDKRRSI